MSRDPEAFAFAPLAGGLAVAGQLTPADLAAAARLGFRAVINNRPDGEAADQPAGAELAAAAARLGLAYRYMPVVSGGVTDADAEAFGRALAELPRPILAFCRSGRRCATLWALGEAKRGDIEAVLAAAAAAGCDLAGLRPRLEARAAAAARSPDDDGAGS